MPNAIVRAAATGLPAANPAVAHATKHDQSARLPRQGINPAALPEEYAMRLVGDCLDPELANGDFVKFTKLQAPEPGDFVILFRRPELVAPGGTQCIIKRLVIGAPDWVTFPWRDNPQSTAIPVVIVEQINPRRAYKVPCADLLAIHKFAGVLRPEQVQWPS